MLHSPLHQVEPGAELDRKAFAKVVVKAQAEHGIA
jgi:hypothetical protein